MFNCLSLHDPSPNDGVPDFRNCTVRVSTNNAAVTGDQVFLNILLPDGGAAPVESCRISGSWTAKTGLTNTAPAKPKANKFKGGGDGGYRFGRNVRADGHDQVPDHHGLGQDQGWHHEGCGVLRDTRTAARRSGDVLDQVAGLQPEEREAAPRSARAWSR